MKKDSVIRNYDWVKIVNPEFFVRVGYLYNKEYILRNKMDQEDVKKIEELIKHFSLKYNLSSYSNNILCMKNYDKIFDKIADGFAYQILKKESFGGHNRQIFTKNISHLKDRKVQVIDRKIVKTGKYCGGSSPSYWNQDDGEMPSLENQKTHVILEIRQVEFDKEGYFHNQPYLKIEKCNVEKIID